MYEVTSEPFLDLLLRPFDQILVYYLKRYTFQVRNALLLERRDNGCLVSSYFKGPPEETPCTGAYHSGVSFVTISRSQFLYLIFVKFE